MQAYQTNTEERTEEQIALARATAQMRAAFQAKAPGALELADEHMRRLSIVRAETLRNHGRRLY